MSDHSSALVNELRRTGHEVLVCSRPIERGLARVEEELRAFRPDGLVLAYVPLGYGPRTGGVAPRFTRWCLGLRRRVGCRAVLLAHEATLPLAHHVSHGELKLALLAAAQTVQFAALLRSFDATLFSNEGTRRLWAKRFPALAPRLDTLRICSNMPHTESADPRAELVAIGQPVPPTTILFFGSGHPSILFDQLERAFEAILVVRPEAQLVVVGMNAELLGRLWPSVAQFGARVRALGYAPAAQVSLWLQVAELVLAPLFEGVGARKGTVMAALQHGKPVITTRGQQTLGDIEWDRICALAPRSAEAFAATAVAVLQSPARKAELGLAARQEYEANASVSVTARRVARLVLDEQS